MFTKEDLQRELREFMLTFAKSIERVFGQNCGGAMVGVPGTSSFDLETEQIQVHGSVLWGTLMAMYEYGVLGRHGGLYGDGHILDGPESDVELFLRGLDSLSQYLGEDDGEVPRLALRTAQTAVARHILDGGVRYSLSNDDDRGEECGYLSFEELALLANMDERSVRNAANPKLPDALVTTSFGRRTLIAVEDANRWLAGRKGFVPTTRESPVPQGPAARAVVDLPGDLERRISQAARDDNLTVSAFLEKLLSERVQGGLQ